MRQYMLNALCLYFILSSNIILPKIIKITAPDVSKSYTSGSQCSGGIDSYGVDSIDIYKNNLINPIETIKINPIETIKKSVAINVKPKDWVTIKVNYWYKVDKETKKIDSSILKTIYTGKNNQKLPSSSTWNLAIAFKETWDNNCLTAISTKVQTTIGGYLANGVYYKTQEEACEALSAAWQNNYCNMKTPSPACNLLRVQWAKNYCPIIKKQQCAGYWDEGRNMCFISREAAQQACSKKNRYWADGRCYKTQEEACEALSVTWQNNDCNMKTPSPACDLLRAQWAKNLCPRIKKQQCTGYWDNGRKMCFISREAARQSCLRKKRHWAVGGCYKTQEEANRLSHAQRQYWAIGRLDLDKVEPYLAQDLDQ